MAGEYPKALVPGPANIGQIIAGHRRRKQQVHNGRPWTQEDLAVAVGSDKGHINRIERGRLLPKRGTLIRICRALDVPYDDEQELLSAAGHAPDRRFPSETELRQIIARASGLLDGESHPALLHDMIGRRWYMNPCGLAFYSSAIGVGADEMWRLTRGKTGLELFFGEATAGQFGRLLPRDHVHRLVARLRRFMGGWQLTPEYQEIHARLARVDSFRQAWTASLVAEERVPYSNHATTIVRHAQLGSLPLEIWWARLQLDNRFFVSHHLAGARSTRQVFAHLSASLRATLHVDLQ